MLQDMLREMAAESNGGGFEDHSGDPQYFVKLKEAALRFTENGGREKFKVGDIVQQIKGFDHKSNEGPIVVVENLKDPLRDDSAGAGNAYYADRNDIICGQIDNGTFILFVYDSRRLELVE